MNATRLSQIDEAILGVVRKASGPVTIKNIMYRLRTQPELADGRSMANVTTRVYDLRRDGHLKQIGVGQDARYTMPDIGKPATEQERQVAEGKRRTGRRYPTTTPQPDEQPQQPPAEQPATEWVEPQQVQPITSVVLDGRRNEPPPAGDLADRIADSIGNTVAITVRSLINEAIGQVRATTAMHSHEIGKLNELVDRQGAQLAEKDATIAQLRAEIEEQSQLYNDLDAKHTRLKQKIAGDLADS